MDSLRTVMHIHGLDNEHITVQCDAVHDNTATTALQTPNVQPVDDCQEGVETEQVD